MDGAHGPGPLSGGSQVVYANLVSDLAVDLEQREVLGAWAEQAPREVWLLRAGDVLVTPVPVDPAFLRYSCALIRVDPDSVAVLTLPEAFAAADRPVPHRAAVEAVRAAFAGRTVTAVLPTALDSAAVGLARALGVPVAPYASGEAAEAALEVTRLLNTKAGFRQAASELALRVPDGRICRRTEVAAEAAKLLASHGEVVIKPDRSAGGHGLRFLTAEGAGSGAAADLAAVGGPEGVWVIEERIDVVRSVSVQMETGPEGPRAVFSGEMRTASGCFTGYVAPLPPSLAPIEPTLESWGRSLGTFLAERGYAGPFSVDAMVTADGEPVAGESNVRRTATTTPQAMVRRLAAMTGAGAGDPAWATGRARASAEFSFDEAVARLHTARIAYDPSAGEGVVLYAGPPPDGLTWRYAVIAPDHAAVARYEELLRSSWAHAR
ncbi:peptide ligase PGM1-related protein [Streptomyces sp. NPDC057854]|uniref:preATP grasp domain-containing protein n=1 Tax=unclassified Streptomyces TaxID=2593676 RepID=UPI0036A34146